MTASEPEIRRAIDAVREHDRPVDVDRERLLQKILRDAPPAGARSRAATTTMAAGALAILVGGAFAWRSTRPPPAVTRAVHVAHFEAPPVDPAPVHVAPSPAPVAPVAAPLLAAPSPRRVTVPAPVARTNDDELRIIREANAALQARQPERALEILSRHAALYPHGIAGPEVMAYQVRAYCMAGRVDEAVATAHALQARAPDSPAAYSLRATCVSRR